MKKLTGFLAGAVVAVLIFGVYCRLGSKIKVEYIKAEVIPASQSESLFANLRAAAQRGEAGVEVFSDTLPDSAGDCFFLTITYRLTNYGPLDAEWITFQAWPESGDVLQVLGIETDVNAFGQTDAEVTLLVRNGGRTGQRAVVISYYVLGRKIEFSCY